MMEDVAVAEAGVVHARGHGVGDIVHIVDGARVEHLGWTGELGLMRAKEDDESAVAGVDVG